MTKLIIFLIVLFTFLLMIVFDRSFKIIKISKTRAIQLYISLFVFMCLILIIVRLNEKSNTDGLYIPPSYDGENISPGEVKNGK